jgi:hypothetical protein
MRVTKADEYDEDEGRIESQYAFSLCTSCYLIQVRMLIDVPIIQTIPSSDRIRKQEEAQGGKGC